MIDISFKADISNTSGLKCCIAPRTEWKHSIRVVKETKPLHSIAPYCFGDLVVHEVPPLRIFKL